MITEYKFNYDQASQKCDTVLKKDNKRRGLNQNEILSGKKEELLFIGMWLQTIVLIQGYYFWDVL